MRIATLAAKILIISNIRIDRMKFTTFLKQMFTSHSGISSKRVWNALTGRYFIYPVAGTIGGINYDRNE